MPLSALPAAKSSSDPGRGFVLDGASFEELSNDTGNRRTMLSFPDPIQSDGHSCPVNPAANDRRGALRYILQHCIHIISLGLQF